MTDEVLDAEFVVEPTVAVEKVEAPAVIVPEFVPSQDQAHAISAIRSWMESPAPLLRLGGYAGTGKTSLLGFIARTLLDEPVAFCTYTGKASTVLRKSLLTAGVDLAKHNVSTIHSLIYKPLVDERTGRVTGWQRRDAYDFPYDMIVIDEASMVPMRILEDLAQFQVPILAVGDHGQLPPVGEPSFLMANPDVRLEKIHRQALDNPIIALSAVVREGNSDKDIRRYAEKAMQDDPQQRVRVCVGQQGVIDAIRFAVRSLEEAENGMLLCSTNAMRVFINAYVRQGFGFEGPPKQNEVVICLKNAYLENGPFIANGVRGRVCQIEPMGDDPVRPHRYLANMRFDSIDTEIEGAKLCAHQFGRSATFKGFDEVPGRRHFGWDSVGLLFDYGYALTAWKAQGSQSDRVAVVMEDWPNEPDQRKRCVYTQVTRASKELALVWAG